VRTTRIYYAAELGVNSTVVLDKTASHHLIRVLRMTAGAEITVFNNSAYEYDCVLLDENQKAASIHVNAVTACHRESPLRIHLLQGVSRGDRMDLTIQKATEIGIDKITPVLCNRTNISLDAERKQKKFDHWQQIIISASEQSGRSQLVKLDNVCSLETALQQTKPALKLVLDPAASASLRTLDKAEEIVLLIGPEGGLTETEIELAQKHGFTGVSLGPRILRTETASIACIAALQALWGDLG
jgi:16S rRNA (uracil1498-N3)-methyltransferase